MKIGRIRLEFINTRKFLNVTTHKYELHDEKPFHTTTLGKNAHKFVTIRMNYLSICGSTVLLLDLGRFFSLLILYTVGRTPWTGDQPVARTLPTHRTAQTQNKRTQTSMN
jgi:hypothetical protein